MLRAITAHSTGFVWLYVRRSNSRRVGSASALRIVVRSNESMEGWGIDLIILHPSSRIADEVMLPD